MWALIFLLITLSVVLGVIAIVLHKILSEISDKSDYKNDKKSLSEHQRMITLINNITDAILSTDEHGIINTYNSAALNLIDTNSGINGEHISQVLNLETTDKKPIDIFKELTQIFRNSPARRHSNENRRWRLYSPGSYACASSGRRQDDTGRICAYLARHHEDEEPRRGAR